MVHTRRSPETPRCSFPLVPGEYIQLHRDTTVGSLTLVPTLRSERRGATGGGGGGIVRASPGALEVSEANSPSPPWKFDLFLKTGHVVGAGSTYGAFRGSMAQPPRGGEHMDPHLKDM